MSVNKIPYELSLWKRKPGEQVEFIIDNNSKINNESITNEGLDLFPKIKIRGYKNDSSNCSVTINGEYWSISKWDQKDYAGAQNYIEDFIKHKKEIGESNTYEQVGETTFYTYPIKNADINIRDAAKWAVLCLAYGPSLEFSQGGLFADLDINTESKSIYTQNRLTGTANVLASDVAKYPVFIRQDMGRVIATYPRKAGYVIKKISAGEQYGHQGLFFFIFGKEDFLSTTTNSNISYQELYVNKSLEVNFSSNSACLQFLDDEELENFITNGPLFFPGKKTEQLIQKNYSSFSLLNNVCMIDVTENVYKTVTLSNYNNYTLIGTPTLFLPVEKARIFSSSNSTYHLQAQNIHFIPNMDSSMQLTFDLPSGGYAPNGEYEQSPFVKEIREEDLIRLSFKDEWYDFVVKKIEEKRENEIIKYSYTCVSDIQEELGRKGYGITFDEFQGNGDIDELGEKVLRDSGWSYIPNKNDFKEAVKQYKQVDGVFQFDSEGRPIEEEVIKEYPVTVYNEELQKYVTKYHGEVTEDGDTTTKITDFYGYQSTELIDAYSCKEMITNGDIFTDAQGWKAGKGVESISAFVNEYKSGTPAAPKFDYAFRLKLKRKPDNDNNTIERRHIEFSNTLFKNSKKGLVGDYFLYTYFDNSFYANNNTNTDFAVYYVLQDGIEHNILKGMLKDVDRKCTTLRLPKEISNFDLKFRLFNSSGFSSEEFYIAKISLFPMIEVDPTRGEDGKIQPFVALKGQQCLLYNSSDKTNISTVTLKEAIKYENALVKYQPKETDTPRYYYLPESFVFEESYISASMKYFILDEQGKVKECIPFKTGADLEEQIVKSDIKIRTHTSEKSNYLNNIYTLASLFEGYPRFYAERNREGGIVATQTISGTDINGNSRTISLGEQKYLKFEKAPGKKRDLSFRYGKNLKEITRTRSSEEIITKMFTEDVNNDALSRGKVSIAWAEDNPSKEIYLYDLSYYAEKGDFSYYSLFADLYTESSNSIGYYPTLVNINEELEPIYLKLESAQDTLSNLEAYDFYLDSAITAAEQEIEDAQAEITKYASKQSGLAGTSTEYKIYQGYIDDAKKVKTAYEHNLKALTKQKKNNIDFLDKTKSEIEVYNQEANILLEKKKQLISLFETKYGIYIKEGTWAGEQYTSDNAYYNDAKQVLASASRPKVEYSVDALDLRAVEGYEFLDFYVGDTVYVEDTELFGFDSVGRPRKIEFVISEINFNLTNPIETTLTVQSYRTPFEQFFSKTYSTITATDKR